MNSSASASTGGDDKHILSLCQLLGLEKHGQSDNQVQAAGPMDHFGWVVPFEEADDAGRTHLGGHQTKKKRKKEEGNNNNKKKKKKKKK